MKIAKFTLIWFLIILILFRHCYAESELSTRSGRFSLLPDWTGIWETEAAHKLQTQDSFSRPTLAGEPPYKSDWKLKVRNAGDSKEIFNQADLPPTIKVCSPSGFPAIMEHPVPDFLFEMLVTPEQTLLVSNEGTIRHIYTDGRKHPPQKELWPTPEGHSIGHWENETLIVDTIARMPGPLGPWSSAASISEKTHFIERITRLDQNSLENVMTIDDSERFTSPWTITIRYRLVTDLDRLLPTDCRGEDRNPLVDGEFIISPP